MSETVLINRIMTLHPASTPNCLYKSYYSLGVETLGITTITRIMEIENFAWTWKNIESRSCLLRQLCCLSEAVGCLNNETHPHFLSLSTRITHKVCLKAIFKNMENGGASLQPTWQWTATSSMKKHGVSELRRPLDFFLGDDLHSPWRRAFLHYSGDHTEDMNAIRRRSQPGSKAGGHRLISVCLFHKP